MKNTKTGEILDYKKGSSQFVDDVMDSYKYIVEKGADVDNAKRQSSVFAIKAYQYWCNTSWQGFWRYDVSNKSQNRKVLFRLYALFALFDFILQGMSN